MSSQVQSDSQLTGFATQLGGKKSGKKFFLQLICLF